MSEDHKTEEVEFELPPCTHFKTFKAGTIKGPLKKKLDIFKTDGCENCSKPHKHTTTEDEEGSEEFTEMSVVPGKWICLTCASVNCGRYEKGHAVSHSSKPGHMLAYNTKNHDIWCYQCNNGLGDILAHSKNNHYKAQLQEFLRSYKELCGDMLAKANRFVAARSHVEDEKDQQEEFKKDLFVSDVKDTSISKFNSNTVPERTHPQTTEVIHRGDEEVKKPNQGGSDDEEELGDLDVANRPACVKGLRNLGNTCFYNSAMQSLNVTWPLYYALCRGVKLTVNPQFDSADIDRNSRHYKAYQKSQGIGEAMRNFLNAMRGDASATTSSRLFSRGGGGGSVVEPSAVLSKISSKESRFRGFAQQDSHELLVCLLDMLNIEERGPVKKSVVNSYSPQKYLTCKTGATNIEAIFQGCFCSTIVCKACGYESRVIDPFMALSLELPRTSIFSTGRSTKKNKYYSYGRDSSDEETPQEKQPHYDDAEGESNGANSSTLRFEGLSEANTEYFVKAESYYYDMSGMEGHRVFEPHLSPGSSSSKTDLEKMLDQFITPEKLDDPKNYYKCEECKKEHGKGYKGAEATKKFAIFEPPQVMVVHLKRFKQGTWSIQKNNKHVTFPFELNLDPYTIQVIDPADNEPTRYRYSLYAIVVHSGGMGGGHYIAYAKHGSQWYYFSDSHSSPVSKDRVANAQAYMLFYERRK